MKENRTYPLRLPRSLKEAVERLSREDRTSINQFVATAVAEKVSALETAKFFADKRARADFKAFDKIMRRRGGLRRAMAMIYHNELRRCRTAQTSAKHSHALVRYVLPLAPFLS